MVADDEPSVRKNVKQMLIDTYPNSQVDDLKNSVEVKGALDANNPHDLYILDMHFGENLAKKAAGTPRTEYAQINPFKRYVDLGRMQRKQREQRGQSDTAHLVDILEDLEDFEVPAVPDGLILIKRIESIYGVAREAPILICTATYAAKAKDFISAGIGEDYIGKDSIMSVILEGKLPAKIYLAQSHMLTQRRVRTIKQRLSSKAPPTAQ